MRKTPFEQVLDKSRPSRDLIARTEKFMATVPGAASHGRETALRHTDPRKKRRTPLRPALLLSMAITLIIGIFVVHARFSSGIPNDPIKSLTTSATDGPATAVPTEIAASTESEASPSTPSEASPSTPSEASPSTPSEASPSTPSEALSTSAQDGKGAAAYPDELAEPDYASLFGLTTSRPDKRIQIANRIYRTADETVRVDDLQVDSLGVRGAFACITQHPYQESTWRTARVVRNYRPFTADGECVGDCLHLAATYRFYETEDGNLLVRVVFAIDHPFPEDLPDSLIFVPCVRDIRALLPEGTAEEDQQTALERELWSIYGNTPEKCFVVQLR